MSINSYKNRKWRKMELLDVDDIYDIDDSDDADYADDLDDYSFLVDEIMMDYNLYHRLCGGKEFSLKEFIARCQHYKKQNGKYYCGFEYYDNDEDNPKNIGVKQFTSEQLIEKYANNYQELIKLRNLSIEYNHDQDLDHEMLLKIVKFFEELPFFQNFALIIYIEQFTERIFELLSIFQNMKKGNQFIISVQIHNLFDFELSNLNNLTIQQTRGSVFDSTHLFLLGKMLENLPFLEKLSINLYIMQTIETICEQLLAILKIQTLTQLSIQINNHKKDHTNQISNPVIKALQETTHIRQFEFNFKTDLVCYYFEKHFSPQGKIINLKVSLNCLSLDNTRTLQDLESLKIMNYEETQCLNLQSNIRNLPKLANLKSLELDFLFKNKHGFQELQQTLCKMNLESLTLKLKHQMISINQPNLKCLNLKIQLKQQFNWKPLVNSLKTMKSLKQLKIQPIHLYKIPKIQNNSFFETLSQISNLDTLDLGIDQLKYSQLNMINKLKNLKCLSLSSRLFNVIDFSNLKKLSYLEHRSEQEVPNIYSVKFESRKYYTQQLLKLNRLVQYKINK